MTYTEIHSIISALKKSDLGVTTRINVVESVYGNIDLSAYDNEGVNELCGRIYDAWCSDACKDIHSIDDITCSIQQLIDDGAYDSPTDDGCLEEAIELAREYELSRGS